jgi:8-oxo-dGTP pyrophosphatase MutT (NUDIX family)
MESSAGSLRELLLSPEEAEGIEAHGRTEAAVLLPMFGWPERPGLIFTERRADLRSHAGEISFPGGRRDPGETYLEAALREAREEIALEPDAVEIAGALPPIGTYVTSYKVHPFVGLVDRATALRASPAEVEAVLRFELAELRAGYAMRRLVSRGIPIRTATYVVGEHLIWGATARILGEFLARLDTEPPKTEP